MLVSLTPPIVVLLGMEFDSESSAMMSVGLLAGELLVETAEEEGLLLEERLELSF